jgi:hypothetical protein
MHPLGRVTQESINLNRQSISSQYLHVIRTNPIIDDTPESVDEICQRISKDTRSLVPSLNGPINSLLLPPMSSNASISSPSCPLKATPLLHSFEDMEENEPSCGTEQILGVKRQMNLSEFEQPNKRLKYENDQNKTVWSQIGNPYQQQKQIDNTYQQQIDNPCQQHKYVQPSGNVQNNNTQRHRSSIAQRISSSPTAKTIRKSSKKSDVGSPTDGSPSTLHSSGEESGRKKHFLNQEAVAILKAWFYDNLDHPYPTADQKEQLSKQTNLSYLQVSNWFTNARKRVWAPGIRIALAANSGTETEKVEEKPVTKKGKQENKRNDRDEVAALFAKNNINLTTITTDSDNYVTPDYGSFDNFLQVNVPNNNYSL